jgi:phage terminase large subunit-like protein
LRIGGKNVKSVFRLFILAGTIAALGSLAYAAEVQGILLDRECSPKIVQAKDQKAAQAHTRDCALMAPCVKAGYGVLTADGAFVLLDPAGNAKAVTALKASRKADNIQVQVTGDRTGDTLKVTAIKIL